MGSSIHPTAIVDPAAKIGADVQIGPYSIIGANVEIGDRTSIGSHVVIEGLTTLGADCEIFQFASVGSKPQDLKFRGEPSTLVIGSRNKIREYVTLQPGTVGGRMTTTIGDNNLFMANSHVGHDCEIGSNNVFANSVALAGHVTVHSNAIVGGLVGIHQFARIGSFVMISAGSMVGQDVPPYCICQGDRAVLRGINTIGLERAGFTAEAIADVKRVYRHLFTTGGHLREKIEILPPETTELPHIKAMIDFIAQSERGILQPSKKASA